MREPGDQQTGERRSDRFADDDLALERLLDAERRRQRLRAVALADATGCLVAGAGAFAECEELAALAPLLAAASAANDAIPTRLDVLERRRAVRRLRLDGIEVLLCGQSDGDGAPELVALAAGCRRILQRA